MTSFKLDTNEREVPAEHREAYIEMCNQISHQLLIAFRDAEHVTIFRDMPFELRLNACLVGAFTGALAPILMTTKRGGDFAIAGRLAAQIPYIVARARALAEDVIANG